MPNFDAIRPYTNAEIPAAFARIMESDKFWNTMNVVFPGVPPETLRAQIEPLHSANDFQRAMVLPLMRKLEQQLTKGIATRGMELLSHTQTHLFISNHRDIVLDSAFLCKCLMENDYDTVEIAIGDNLLAEPWVADFVRINKSFIVKRGGAVRELLENSRTLSAYIRHAVCEKKAPVWIAQREGRAKDSNDRTQDSLLKMLAMSGEGSIPKRLSELNIMPLSISYEYDPCDFLKAQELQQKRDDPDFRKSAQDDQRSMGTGVMGQKGHVTFAFTPCITPQMAEIEARFPDKKEQVEAIARLIDQQIFAAYAIYPGNRVAYDLLTGTQRFAADYSPAEKQTFEEYLTHQLGKIDLPHKDDDFLRHKMLEMYANPLRNQLGEL